MANTYFRFRQFTVHQGKCAMKVCTDACVFGAWTASLLKDGNDELLLDIGTGTGLLSLMIAQQTSGNIHAVEIDSPAFLQASENFQSSPWKKRLSIYHSSIQDYNPGVQYDFIFSNPPFFENELKSANDQRNLALHSSALTLYGLLKSVNRLLKPGGKFAILLPWHRALSFENDLKKEAFYIAEKILVRQTPRHTPFRCIYLLTKLSADSIASHAELIIKDGNDSYTKRFVDLLKDYYLFEKNIIE